MYDVAIIGAGPGGYVCAIRAAQLGLKTICIEKAELGGVCLNWGCIPTKALIKTAELYNELRHGERHGIKADKIEVDFSRVIARSREVAGRLNKGVQGLFKKYKVEHMAGQASLKSPTTLEVQTKDGPKTIEARHTVIATGARPKTLPNLKPDGKVVITSREAMILPKLPERMLIIGGGPIGLEFAYFYASFDTKVTLVEFAETILPFNDRELSGLLAKSLGKRGIDILTSAKAAEVQVSPEGCRAKIVGAKDDKEIRSVQAEICLLAVGMTGNIEGLGLEPLGVKTERGFVVIDQNCCTSVKNILAIGDVAGSPLLAHKASYEAHLVAEQLAGKGYEPLDKRLVPGCTYTHPQFAALGLTEEECKAQKLEYSVGKFPFLANGMSLAAGESEGVVKLIFGKKHGELLGAHVLGANAAELIAELTLAMKLECTHEEIVATIHAHPTLSEMIPEAAAQAFGHAIHI